MRKSDPAWFWMAGAFGSALILAAAILVIHGSDFEASSWGCA
jgi:uncharacterized membrane protein YdcZ (DUF606 family)